MLNYLDDTELLKKVIEDDRITQDRLTRLTPQDVMRWFNFLVFGVKDPEPPPRFKDMKSQIRKSTVEFFKKIISFHIPNKLFS